MEKETRVKKTKNGERDKSERDKDWRKRQRSLN